MADTNGATKRPADSSDAEVAAKKAKVQAESEAFLASYQRLKKDILDQLPEYEMPDFGVEYWDRMVDYTTLGGKMNRGLAVIDALRVLKGGESLSEEQVFEAHALGWCIELIQAFFLVADDVMDSSVTRRGNPCWYRVPHIGVTGAVNDALILESLVFRVIKNYFRSKPYYLKLYECLHEVIFQTEIGQHLDVSTQPPGKGVDFTKFTLKHYKRIVKYKTAFYSFYVPLESALILAGVTDDEVYRLTREISCAMGEYFQIQDDYLDCYGRPEDIGKIGTDIQDGKCSWLAVQALSVASAEQRKLFEEKYGRDDEECIAAIKKLYNDLKLAETFHAYEDDAHKNICALIDSVKGAPAEMYHALLRKIFKRKK